MKIYQNIAIVAGSILLIGTMLLFLQGNWLLGLAFVLASLMELYAYFNISRSLKSLEDLKEIEKQN